MRREGTKARRHEGTKGWSAGVLLVACALSVAAGPPQDGDVLSEFTEQEIKRILRHSPLGDLPATTSAFADDPRAAELGQRLFFDSRASANGQVSCATCHDPARGFADGKGLPETLGTGTRHTPALWNVAYNRWYFWDGRADSLWSQALQPIENEIEMGSSRLRLAHIAYGDASWRSAYESIFGPMPDLPDAQRFPADARPVPGHPDHPHHVAWTAMWAADQDAINRVFANLGKAIEAHQRRLVSRRAPFDVFVEGLRERDPSRLAALPPAARRGLKLFIGRGECRLCHSGPTFSDGEFHDIRVPPRDGGLPRDAARFDGVTLLLADPFNAAGPFSDAPDGEQAARLGVLANVPANWGRFKTPTLRNVSLTAPYMHQGQFATLRDVLRYYSTLEGAVSMDHHDETILVPRDFTEEEIADLIAFLRSLTDASIDPALLEAPVR